MVIESDLLSPDDAVVVFPLMRDYPAVTKLNTMISFDDDDFVLATRRIASVRRNSLKKVGTARRHRNEITRAIDILMFGI